MGDDEKQFRGVSARLEPDEIEKLDELALELSKRAKGARVSRGAVAKMAIARGVVVLERELRK